MTPAVSVVVPCHDAGPYLVEALASITEQQLDVETIVVDDGSTDDSAAVAERAGARVVRQPNQGASAARNAGVAIARAPLLAFLDADDLWPAGSLAARLAALDAEPALGAVCGLTEQFVSPDLPADRREALAPSTVPVRGRVPGALLVRRTVFDRVGPFDPRFRMGEMLDWIARVELAGVRIGEIDRVVLRRRVHGSNSVWRTGQLHADYLRVLRAAIVRRRAAAAG